MVTFKQFSSAARVAYLEEDLFEIRFSSPLTQESYSAEVSGEDVIADLRGSFQDDESDAPANPAAGAAGDWKTRLLDPRFKGVVLRFAWGEIMPELEAEEEEEEEEEFYEEEEEDEDWV